MLYLSKVFLIINRNFQVEIVGLTISLIGLWLVTGIIDSHIKNKERKLSNNRFDGSNKNEMESSTELWEEKPLFIEFWEKSFDFKSKTNRKVFWRTVLQVSSIYVGGVLLFFLPESGESIEHIVQFTWFYAIFSFIPNLSIQIRRLNDIGKEPVWVLLSFVPFVSLILIFWYAKPSQKSPLTENKKRRDLTEINGTDELSKAEEQLAKLKSMLERGVISAQEYEELRKKTLGL